MSSDKETKTEALLSEMLKWTRFMASDKVRSVLHSTLDTPQKQLIYHLSDGTKGSVEIASKANTSDRTVRRYWESWGRTGIVEIVKVRGGDRYRKSFELEDFGFKVPSVPEAPPVQTPDSPEATSP